MKKKLVLMLILALSGALGYVVLFYPGVIGLADESNDPVPVDSPSTNPPATDPSSKNPPTSGPTNNSPPRTNPDDPPHPGPVSDPNDPHAHHHPPVDQPPPPPPCVDECKHECGGISTCGRPCKKTCGADKEWRPLKKGEPWLHTDVYGGKCVQTTPDCKGKKCGDSDGVGGKCSGKCDDPNDYCIDKTCVKRDCNPTRCGGTDQLGNACKCPKGKECRGKECCTPGLYEADRCKCPSDKKLVNGKCVQKNCGLLDCVGKETCYRVDGKKQCVIPNCVGKCGGPDGAGGTCPNTCGHGKACIRTGNSYICKSTNCFGAKCGTNAAGQSCGTCPKGQYCDGGKCVKPQCGFFTKCGEAPNLRGKGNLCGTCPSGLECKESGFMRIKKCV